MFSFLSTVLLPITKACFPFAYIILRTTFGDKEKMPWERFLDQAAVLKVSLIFLDSYKCHVLNTDPESMLMIYFILFYFQHEGMELFKTILRFARLLCSHICHHIF